MAHGEQVSCDAQTWQGSRASGRPKRGSTSKWSPTTFGHIPCRPCQGRCAAGPHCLQCCQCLPGPCSQGACLVSGGLTKQKAERLACIPPPHLLLLPWFSREGCCCCLAAARRAGFSSDCWLTGALSAICSDCSGCCKAFRKFVCCVVSQVVMGYAAQFRLQLRLFGKEGSVHC